MLMVELLLSSLDTESRTVQVLVLLCQQRLGVHKELGRAWQGQLTQMSQKDTPYHMMSDPVCKLGES